MIFLLLTKQQQLPGTECGLSVTPGVNLVCQIKKGHVERTWQNGVWEEKKCPLDSVDCFFSTWVQWKLFSHSRGKCSLLLEAEAQLGANFTWYFGQWMVLHFLCPFSPSIWLERRCTCNICLHQWPLYFYLFIRAMI